MLREALERTVEDLLTNVQALIVAMDQVDGDADLEPGVDREAIEEREPDADLEPRLGWPAWGGSPAAWASPGGVDADLED